MRALFNGIIWLVRYFRTGFQLSHLAYGAFVVLVVVAFLDQILLVVAHVAGLLLSGVLWVFGHFLLWLLAQLPGMPDMPPLDWGALLVVLGPVNRYFPVAELFSYLAVYAAVVVASFSWKLVKFFRGGG